MLAGQLQNQLIPINIQKDECSEIDNHREAMPLRETIEASLTIEESSANDDTKTWTASETKQINKP